MLKQKLKELWKLVQEYVLAYLRSRQIESQGILKYDDVKKCLKDAGITKYEITDMSYYTLLVSDMQEFLKINMARLKKYKTGVYDCENFAHVLLGQASLMLSGFAIGTVHVERKDGRHALCFMLTHDKRFFYIEPQTNNIFNLARGKQMGYKPYFALI